MTLKEFLVLVAGFAATMMFAAHFSWKPGPVVVYPPELTLDFDHAVAAALAECRIEIRFDPCSRYQTVRMTDPAEAANMRRRFPELKFFEARLVNLEKHR